METTLELSLDELAILQKVLIKYCQSAESRRDHTRSQAVQLLHKVDDAEDNVLLGSYLTRKLTQESTNV